MKPVIVVASIVCLLFTACISADKENRHKKFGVSTTSGVIEGATSSNKEDESIYFEDTERDDDQDDDQIDDQVQNEDEGSGVDSEASGDSSSDHTPVAAATAPPTHFSPVHLPANSTDDEKHMDNNLDIRLIAASTCAGILTVVFLTVAAILCVRRRRQKQDPAHEPRRRAWEKGYKRALMNGEFDV